MVENRKIRMGVIGCGQFMSRQHIQTINRSDNLELYYLSDKDEQRLGDVASVYKPTKTTTDWREVVAEADVDIVVAGIVPDYHPEIVRAAIENGKPVYIEKPLSVNSEEGREIQGRAERLQVPLAVGFNRRFAPAICYLKPIFDARDGSATVYYRISDDDNIRPVSQQWKKQDRLIIEAVHIFDIISYLLNAEPVSVYAVESRFNDALVTLTYSDGSQGTILSSSWGSLAQPKERLEAVLDRRTVEMSDYVEVGYYGDNSYSQRKCFAGRQYDGCDNGHVAAFEAEGLGALIRLRHKYNDAMLQSGVLADSSDESGWDKARELLGDRPVPQINYTPDKGWGRALEAFCESVMLGKEVVNAGAKDANRAFECARAARKSIESKQPVELNSSNWF